MGKGEHRGHPLLAMLECCCLCLVCNACAERAEQKRLRRQTRVARVVANSRRQAPRVVIVQPGYQQVNNLACSILIIVKVGLSCSSRRPVHALLLLKLLCLAPSSIPPQCPPPYPSISHHPTSKLFVILFDFLILSLSSSFFLFTRFPYFYNTFRHSHSHMHRR